MPLTGVLFMQLSDLELLRDNATKELNTIESIDIIDHVNGKLTAINHAFNRAITLSKKDELDQQGITELNQFCSDRMAIFSNSLNDLDLFLYRKLFHSNLFDKKTKGERK